MVGGYQEVWLEGIRRYGWRLSGGMAGGYQEVWLEAIRRYGWRLSGNMVGGYQEVAGPPHLLGRLDKHSHHDAILLINNY